MSQSILVILTGIIVAGIAAQWLAWRVRVPAILFLLAIGLVLGPITGWLNPNQLLGDLLFPLVSLAVAVILFEGALTLRFSEIRGVNHTVWLMVSLGGLISWAVAAYAAYLFVGLSPPMAAMFGALVVVTGPTVIMPLLRIVRPNPKVAAILRWEGILIDPIGAVLAVIVFEWIHTHSHAHFTGGGWLALIWPFVSLLGIGTLLGLFGGYLLGSILRHHWLPDYLINVVVLAAVLSVFTVSNLIAEESGLVAVTAMGVLLANMRGVPLTDVLRFKETLTLLFISSLFILLAARIEPAMFTAVGFGALLVWLAIQFVAQPLKVLVCTIGSGLNWREKLLTAWIGPRGIVAAAVSGLFALRLDQNGVAGAELLVPLVFVVIFGTVVLASLTARPLALRLKVSQPEDRGVLIVGSNPFSRALAAVLQKQGLRAVIADNRYTDIRAARMAGLETFYGNPVSEAADQQLDLTGIGRLLALSAAPEVNHLAALRYRHEFGAERVFVLKTAPEAAGSARERRSELAVGRVLFGADITLESLQAQMLGGAELFSTRLTETFTWEKYQERFGAHGQVLMAITPKQDIMIWTEHEHPQPPAGALVIGLYSPTLVHAEPGQEPASVPSDDPLALP